MPEPILIANSQDNLNLSKGKGRKFPGGNGQRTRGSIGRRIPGTLRKSHAESYTLDAGNRSVNGTIELLDNHVVPEPHVRGGPRYNGILYRGFYVARSRLFQIVRIDSDLDQANLGTGWLKFTRFARPSLPIAMGRISVGDVGKFP